MFEANIYLPLAIKLDGSRDYSVIGRLRSGVSVGSASAELAAIAGRTAQEDAALNSGWSAAAVPLLDQTVGGIRPVLLILFGAAGLILSLACINIANLLLMRSASRTREISVRLALGAGNSRIFRQLFVENLLVAVSGGLAGVAFAVVAVRFIRNSLPESLRIPRLHDVALDLPVLAFSLGVTRPVSYPFRSRACSTSSQARFDP